jgi:hypothetical protein
MVFVHGDVLCTRGMAVTSHRAQGLRGSYGWEGIALISVGFEKNLPLRANDTPQTTDCLQSGIYHGIDILSLNDDQKGFAATSNDLVLATTSSQGSLHGCSHV